MSRINFCSKRENGIFCVCVCVCLCDCVGMYVEPDGMTLKIVAISRLFLTFFFFWFAAILLIFGLNGCSFSCKFHLCIFVFVFVGPMDTSFCFVSVCCRCLFHFVSATLNISAFRHFTLYSARASEILWSVINWKRLKKIG